MSELRLIAVADLVPWPGLNPRRRFSEERLQELASSVREKGVLQPLLVHDGPDIDTPHAGWIVAGETRWRAAQLAEVESIPCIVREFQRAEALEVALLENLQRADLTAIEEARGFKRLIDETGSTQAQLAERVGKSQPYVANRIRLLELPDVALQLIEDEILPPATARDLLLPFAKIPDEPRAKLYEGFAKWIRKNVGAEASQVRRELGNIAARLSRPLTGDWIYGVDQGIQPTFDRKLHKGCSCNGPKFMYGYQESVRCFDEAWWNARLEEVKAAEEAEVAKSAKQLQEAGATTVTAHYKDYHAFHKRHAYGTYEDISSRSDLYDPVKLAGARFATYGDEQNLVCLDAGKARAAKTSASREIAKRLKARREALDAELIGEANDAGVDDLYTVLRFLLNKSHERPDLAAAAKAFGIEIPTYSREDDLAKIPPVKLFPLARLIQLRVESGAWKAYDNPVEKQIKEQLRREYAPGMKALLIAARNASAGSPKKDESPVEKQGARARRREKREAAAAAG